MPEVRVPLKDKGMQPTTEWPRQPGYYWRRVDEPSIYVTDWHVIDRYRKQIISQHVEHAREITLCGKRGRIVACSVGEIMSEIGQSLAAGYDFGGCYFDTDEKERVFSLRSLDDGTDVSEIAKSFGGGGHEHAAGFKIPI